MGQSEPIVPVLEDLHFLPVSQRVIFKSALMVWKCVHGVAPAYLSNLLPSQVVSLFLVSLLIFWLFRLVD